MLGRSVSVTIPGRKGHQLARRLEVSSCTDNSQNVKMRAGYRSHRDTIATAYSSAISPWCPRLHVREANNDKNESRLMNVLNRELP